jgi:hypothetical protein
LGNLYLKGINPNLSQLRGIKDFGSLGKEPEQLKNHKIVSDSRDILGEKSLAKEAQSPHT